MPSSPDQRSRCAGSEIGGSNRNHEHHSIRSDRRSRLRYPCSSGQHRCQQSCDAPGQKSIGAISEVAIHKVGSSRMVNHAESSAPDHLFGLLRRPGETQWFAHLCRHRRECEDKLPAHVVQVRVTEAVLQDHLSSSAKRCDGFERRSNCTRGQVRNDAEPGEERWLVPVEPNGIKSATSDSDSKSTGAKRWLGPVASPNSCIRSRFHA